MSAFRPGLTIAALAACVGLLSACSQDAATLDEAAAAPLHARVADARAALAANNGPEVRSAMDEFRARVTELADSGSINRDDAQVLVAYSQQIDAGIPATLPGQSAATPKLVAPRHLDDVTAPVPAAPAPEQPSTPAGSTAPVPRPAPVATIPSDDDRADDDAGDRDPGDAAPGNEDPATENPSEDPENSTPDSGDEADTDSEDNSGQPAPGDTDSTSDGAGE